jgi:hypothetical protein
MFYFRISNLEELDLSENKITRTTIKRLVELMKCGAVPKLQKLKISRASLTEEEVWPLFEYLEQALDQVSFFNLLILVRERITVKLVHSFLIYFYLFIHSFISRLKLVD